MTDDIMHQARFTRTDDEDVVVSVPGRFPLPPEVKVFSRGFEKGMLAQGFHLACRHCEAKVQFNRGAHLTHGSNAVGRVPYFARRKGESHSPDCAWQRNELPSRRTKFDKTLGYKIHINTGGGAAYAAYKKDRNGRLQATDSRLLNREAKHINEIGDLVRLLKNGDPERIKKSLVVYQQFIMPWQEFFLRGNRNPAGLQARFMSAVLNIPEGRARPCLMEFNLAAGVLPPGRFDNKPLTVRSTRLFLEPLPDGRSQVVIPCAVLRNRHNTLVTGAFNQPGRYLALGYVRKKTIDTPRDRIHFLDVGIDDPAQVIKCDVATLRR